MPKEALITEDVNEIVMEKLLRGKSLDTQQCTLIKSGITIDCAIKKRGRMTPIKECPHCHSDWGVFTKSDLINVPTNYNFDGSRAYNGEMYDNAEKIIDKPTVYCQKCGKKNLQLG